MSDNLNEKIEATRSTLRRTSRRILYIALAGICSVVIGVWLRSAFANASAATVQEEARYFTAQPVAPSSSSVPGTLQYVQNVPAYTLPAQNPLQERSAPGLTYAPSQPLLQSQPQDPAENEATIEINQIRNELRSATGEQKKELSEKLTDAVGKLFDVRHAAQAKQVEKLEAELAEAKELHKKRGNRKAEIIERRIAELLQSADDLAWNRDLAGRPSTTNNYADINTVTRPLAEVDSIPRNGVGATVLPSSPAGMYTWRGSDPNSGYPTAPTYRSDPNYSPYRANQNYPPGTNYPNPAPQSSTPSQFIPLDTQDSGQTNLLQSVPSANPTGSAPALPNLPRDASLISKTVIEAAYDYEEALDVAIETKSRYRMGAASKRELSTTKRNAAKSKAIWAGLLREITQQREVKEEEITENLYLSRESSTSPEKRLELHVSLSKLKAERQSIVELQAWVEEFNKQSLATLEKQFEQSEEPKAEEKKTEKPSEKVEIASPDGR